MKSFNLDKTYCNPTPLPDYPIGRTCYTNLDGKTFRETADPSVIYEDGKWYLYPSCGMAYWSDDFIHWNHERLDTYDIGYAPTVVKHKGKFYLTACLSDIYVGDTPLGPFKSLGAFKKTSGEEIKFYDPMVFSDDDERLYIYYYNVGGGIGGAELDKDDPTQLITEPALMFPYDTVNHEWERLGDWCQDGNNSCIEGPWMYKRNGVYYLTYCGPGTEWQTYAMGAYKGPTPMGPWTYMETSPFITKKSGIVRGPGHGCIVDGPNGTTWAFYTCTVCYSHPFERRIGYDPIGFDENGDINPCEATEIPQYVPGYNSEPEKGNNVGIIPLTQRCLTTASSYIEGRNPIYAVDDSMITWWQPTANDPKPSLTFKLSDLNMNICSMRIIWRDVGISVRDNVAPGPFKYIVEAKEFEGDWVTVLDESANDKDMLIDYKPIKEMKAKFVRLTITGHPEGVTPAVTNFTVFGYWK